MLTSVRANCPVEPAEGAEGGDHEEDHQAEDQRHPVRDNHYWRIRSVYALPGDQYSYLNS